MIRVELPFPVPLSACFTNVKGRGRVPTQRYKDWQDDAARAVRQQKPGMAEGEVSVYVRLVAPDKRHRDAGNVDKAVCDILVKMGVIQDDSNRYVKRLTYEWAEEGPACVVLVQPIDKLVA